jgi:hypothetical protein
MALNLSPIAGAAWQFFSNDGVPLAGGLLYTYAAGTSTPLTTYTNPLGNIPNTNPIVMDSAGRPPQEVWLQSLLYKFVLKDASGNLIGSWDNIAGIPASNQQNYQTATQGQVAFTVGFTYIAGSNTLNVMVNGSKQIVGVNYTETNSTTVTFANGLNAGDIVEFYIS